MRSRVTCVVPARLGSTRFFGKLLEPIFGKPVVVHTLERAAAAGCFDRVICLTDSPAIGAATAAQGFDFVLTGEAANGTERIARALDLPGPHNLGDSDLFVNLQGDEPAFPEDGLRTLCAALHREPEYVHLLVHADAPTRAEIENPNRVKAVVDADGFVTGFVRGIGTSIHRPAPIRTDDACVIPAGGIESRLQYRLQLGAYAYSRDYLARYAALPPSAAEIEMSHEMLRAPGLAPLRAQPAPSKHGGASVDVPEDLIAAHKALEALENHKARKSPPRQPRPQGVPA